MKDGLLNILNSIADWFCSLISTVTAAIANFIVNQMIGYGDFAPNMEYFSKMIGTSGEDNYYLTPGELLSGGWSSLSNFKRLQFIAMTMAFILLLIIFVMELLQRVLGAVVEFKQGLASTFGRLFMSIFMIFIAFPLVDLLMQYGTEVWKYLTQILSDTTSGLGDASSDVANAFASASAGAVAAGIPASIAAGAWGLIKALVQAILSAVVLYFFIKISFEIIQHYLMTCVLGIFAPCSAAFFVSDDTIITFKTYWKMFMTEVGLLVFNMMWIRLSVVVIGHTDGIIGAFAAVAFMRIGTQANNIARSLGLSTSGMVGTLVDSMAITAGGLMAFTSNAIHMAGRGMAMAGSYTGQSGLVRAGLFAQGKNAGFADVNKEMQGNIGGVLGQKRAENTQGRHGRLYNAQAQKDFNRMLGSGLEGRRSAEQFLGMFTGADRQKLLQGALDSGQYANLSKAANAQGLALKAVDFTSSKGLQVEAGEYDKSINNGINGIREGSPIVKATVSDFDTSGANAKFASNNGDVLYFNPEGKVGERVQFEAGETPNGFSRAEATLGTSIQAINPELFNDDGSLKQGVHIEDYAWEKNADGSYSSYKLNTDGGEVGYDPVAPIATVGGLKDSMDSAQNYLFKDAEGGGIDVLASADSMAAVSFPLAEDSGIKAYADTHDGNFDGASVCEMRAQNGSLKGFAIADKDGNYERISDKEARTLIDGGVAQDLSGSSISEDGTFSTHAFDATDGMCVVGHIDTKGADGADIGITADDLNANNGDYSVRLGDDGYALCKNTVSDTGYEDYSKTDKNGQMTYTGALVGRFYDGTTQVSAFDGSGEAIELSDPEDVIRAQFCHQGETFIRSNGEKLRAAEEGAWADANIPHDKIKGFQIKDDGTRFDIVTEGSNGQEELTACYIGGHAAKNAGIELTHTNISRGNADYGTLYYGKAKKIEVITPDQGTVTAENFLKTEQTIDFYTDTYKRNRQTPDESMRVVPFRRKKNRNKRNNSGSGGSSNSQP